MPHDSLKFPNALFAQDCFVPGSFVVLDYVSALSSFFAQDSAYAPRFFDREEAGRGHHFAESDPVLYDHIHPPTSLPVVSRACNRERMARENVVAPVSLVGEAKANVAALTALFSPRASETEASETVALEDPDVLVRETVGPDVLVKKTVGPDVLVRETIAREGLDALARETVGPDVLVKQTVDLEGPDVLVRETAGLCDLDVLVKKTVGPGPDVLVRVTVRPDVLVRVTVRPDVLVRETVGPDVLVRETVRPDVLVRETVRPEVLVRETVRPDVLVRESGVEEIRCSVGCGAWPTPGTEVPHTAASKRTA